MTSETPDRPTDTWRWLEGTYWYCPSPSMPAIQTRRDNRFRWVLDQTVWKITGSRQGYLWGVASALLTPLDEEPDIGQKADLAVYGSITPGGRVHMTFIRSPTSVTVGTGRVTQHRGEPSFEMQMSSGPASALAVHWAYMLRVEPGDPAWENLPGAGVSVPEMVDGLEAPEAEAEAVEG